MARHIASQRRHKGVCDGRVQASRHVTPPLRGVTCDGDDTALPDGGAVQAKAAKVWTIWEPATARGVKFLRGRIGVSENLGMRVASTTPPMASRAGSHRNAPLLPRYSAISNERGMAPQNPGNWTLSNRSRRYVHKKRARPKLRGRNEEFL
jgi:hypothetical protein